ncbi:MAG TPA: DUF4259 domain-containing protein [Kribbella sp.]|nr:DUF4259 domain-containing protein [Kribbella sp.]
MGAWDASVFGNDDAADWVGDLADGGTTEQVEDLLREVAGLPADEYLEGGQGAEALAAAELVAAALGRGLPANAYSEAGMAWVAQHPEVAKLRDVAKAAVERVRAGESELVELWQDADAADYEVWQAAAADLLSRLG